MNLKSDAGERWHARSASAGVRSRIARATCGAIALSLLLAAGSAAPVSARAPRHGRLHASGCMPLRVPSSAAAEATYLRSVTLKRSRLNGADAELRRYGRRLQRGAHGPRRVGRGLIGRLRSTVGRLRREVACLTRELTRTFAPSGVNSIGVPSVPSPGGKRAEQPPVEPVKPTDVGVSEEPDASLEAPPEATAPEQSSGGGGLSIAVAGNRLVNGEGEPVTLHGVDISGTQWQCLAGGAFDSPVDEASIAAMVAWHINAVRIPLNEDCWLGINGVPGSAEVFRSEIAEYVERLHAHGIYAILDLHWSAPGSTLAHMGASFAGNFGMSDADHSPAFWGSVASYFQDDHAVLFDLYNEPTEISWSCWLEGCVSPRGFLTAGMQELVDSVRATGATQPIMVSGLEKASADGREWLAYRPWDPDGQLVASAHIYGQTKISRFESNLGVVAAQFPVVLGEVGEKDCRDVDLNSLLPWADRHGVSYLAWDWFVGSCADPSLISDYEGTPTPYGLGYREHLRASFAEP